MSKSPEKKPDQKSNLPSTISSDNEDALEETIEELVLSKLQGILPKNQEAQVVQRMVSLVRSESFRGPIAHPKHLKAYEEALPGSADRIIKMAEDALSHNIRMAAKECEADIKDRSLGMWLGFAICLSFIVAAVVFAFLNHANLAAATIAGSVISGAVGLFIRGRQKDKQ